MKNYLEQERQRYRQQRQEQTSIKTRKQWFARNHQDINYDCLSDREAEVIKLYFGVDIARPLTLKDIAVIFGVTPSRISALKNRAQNKLFSQKKP